MIDAVTAATSPTDPTTTITPSTAGTSSSSSSSSSTSATANPGGELSENQFLNLLVTQLQNQDPLDPQPDDAFITELAQFTSVQDLTQIQSDTDTMVSDLNAMSPTNTATSASSTATGSDPSSGTPTAGTSSTGTTAVGATPFGPTPAVTTPAGTTPASTAAYDDQTIQSVLNTMIPTGGI